MRRPAPLPSPEDEPADLEVEQVVPRRSSRSSESTAAEPDAAEPGDTAEVIDLQDKIVDPDEQVATAMRSSEVWRAARARRKALRAEIRRFTQRSRRRRLIVWGSIGAVLALVLGSVVAAYSPLFAVEKITVAGARTLKPALVQEALKGQIGTPLALVDASAVKSALTEFPMIETYALEARPPHELLVRIVERTPIGVIKSQAGYSLVDAAGVVLATTPDKPEDRAVLEITGGRDSQAFHSAGLVMRSLPADLRATVSTVTATSGDDVTLALQDGKTIVWGSEKESSMKAAVLVRLIKASPESRTFDVSSPTVPVVR